MAAAAMNLPLLLHFVRQDLVDKHAGSALGALWVFLLPLANILIFTLVFSTIMGARLGSMGLDYLGDYGYSVYLITGLLAWNAFSQTLVRVTDVFHDKAGLITKVNMPLLSLPLYIVLSESLLYGIALLFFAVFLVLIDFRWSLHCLWLPVIFAIQQLLAYGLGLLCAIFSVFFRDIKTLVNIAAQLWFWLTPIVYVLAILPAKWASLITMNPVYHLAEGYRTSLILGQMPAWPSLAWVLLLAAAVLGAALVIGRKLEKDIRDFL